MRGLLLLLVVVLGLGLRLYRLDDESVDHEEYVSVSHLDAPNLIAFIEDVKNHYPYSSPLPFAFQYVWAGCFGTQIFRVRLLFVLAGTLTVLLVYAFTYTFYGGGTLGHCGGLIAGLCAALSPVHVFCSQEARQYAFLTLFALLSMYTFLKAWRERGQTERPLWWAANAAANACVLWSHHFAVLILIVEGLFLLLFGRTRLRQAAAWFVVHFILCVPLGLWILSIDLPPGDVVYSYYGKPGLGKLLWDTFADDVLFLARYYPHPAANAWQWVSPEWRASISEARLYLGGGLVAIFCVSTLWLVIRMIRAAFVQGPESNLPDHGDGAGPTAAEYLFLLIWIVLPVAVLAALTYFWRPCYSTRYTMYCSLAVYVAVGGALGSIQYRGLRVAAVALCGILYVYQMSLSLPGPTRTDWKSVARLIEQEGSPHDIILVEDAFWLPEFLFNQGATAHPVSDAFERDTLCEMANFLLARCAESPDEQDRTRHVWVLLVDIRFEGKEAFAACVEARDLALAARRFPGERPVEAIHLWRPAPREGDSGKAGQAVPESVMDALARTVAQHGDAPPLTAYREAVRYKPDATGAAYVRIGLALARQNAVALASAAFQHAVRFNPDLALELSQLVHDLTGAADTDAAKAQADSLRANGVPILEELTAKLARETQGWPQVPAEVPD